MWSTQFKAARGKLTASEVAAAISAKLSPRTVEEWAAGRRQPPEWVQELVLKELRKKVKKT